MSDYFIYILECSNGAYYTGYTTDIERRYQEHLDGSAKCKYTRSFPPVGIAACWQFKGAVSQALKIELKIKNLSRSQKNELISSPDTINALVGDGGVIYSYYPKNRSWITISGAAS